jgi:NitT/TauT family transport system permease protein
MKNIKNFIKELFKFGGSLGKKTSIILSIIGVLITVTIWEYLAINSYGQTQAVVPPLSLIFKGIPILFNEHNLLSEAWYSISLNLFGYFFGILFAIPLGFLIGIYALPREMFLRLTNGLRYVPPPTITGIFAIALGYGFQMKGTFLAFTIFISLLPAVIQKIIDLQNPKNDKDYVFLQTIHTLGANNRQKLTKVYIPYVMGRLWDDICNLTAISWTYISIVELLNRTGGLGGLLMVVRRQGLMDLFFGILLIIMMFGILQDAILKEGGKLLYPYKYEKISVIRKLFRFIKKNLLKLFHICFENHDNSKRVLIEDLPIVPIQDIVTKTYVDNQNVKPDTVQKPVSSYSDLI